MIATISGRAQAISLDSVVVLVGGVGLLVQASPRTLTGVGVGDSIQLATSLVVREDSLTLFGFADDDERATFEVLLSVSGIGPKLALAMLAVHEPEALRRAVATDDLAALRRVPGVGLKVAQRIALELKGKIGLPGAPISGTQDSVPTGWSAQVREALIGLGWPAKACEDAVKQVTPAAGQPIDVPALLRAALGVLGKP